MLLDCIAGERRLLVPGEESYAPQQVLGIVARDELLHAAKRTGVARVERDFDVAVVDHHLLVVGGKSAVHLHAVNDRPHVLLAPAVRLHNRRHLHCRHAAKISDRRIGSVRNVAATVIKQLLQRGNRLPRLVPQPDVPALSAQSVDCPENDLDVGIRKRGDQRIGRLLVVGHLQNVLRLVAQVARHVHRLRLECDRPARFRGKVNAVEQVQSAKRVQAHILVFAGIVGRAREVGGGDHVQLAEKELHVRLVVVLPGVFLGVGHEKLREHPGSADPPLLSGTALELVEKRVEDAVRRDAFMHHRLQCLFTEVVVVLKHGVNMFARDSHPHLAGMQIV